jgi:hypothetical protein
MVTFQVGKDFETPEQTGAEGFQVDSLIDDNGNDLTNRIDVGIIFRDDEHLKEYLSTIFGIPASQFDIDEL